MVTAHGGGEAGLDARFRDDHTGRMTMFDSSAVPRGWLGRALGALLVAPALLTAGEPAPLARAHAHNDYEHPHPLLDALAQGFCSVEADIFLVDGQLLVAHDRNRVRPERTLQALYLDPLLARVREQGGRVFRDGPPFWLLIDFKTEADPTWTALKPVLERYREMLTTFENERTDPKAVTVILSGNSPQALLSAEPRRLAALDGRPADLQSNPSPHLVPWISESWSSLFQWRGEGPMPETEQRRLRERVALAHQQGRRVRFWGSPDLEARWQIERDLGVDLINTDRLAELAAFLRRE